MFVVYVSSQRDIKDYGNCYGYYAGKCYTKDGEYFPITDNSITERTKKYKSKTMAIKGAEAVFIKCGYVKSYITEEIK